ncbi:MAG: alpha/beta hydrolase fold domain-containing protein [Candidatus Microthrix parvicella]
MPARSGDEIVRDGRRLDPQMRALLTVAERVAPTKDRQVATARVDIGRSVMVGPPVPPGVHTWERDLPGPAGPIRVHFHRAATTAPGAPAICFLHGGGWAVGDLDSHDPPCRVLAQDTGAVVMAVDYRLAPEHPYPAAIDDCVAAYAWLAGHSGELGLDATRLAIMGDSAGGNLAALMARAGVPVVDRCFDDLIHGFYNIGITRPTLLAAHEINRTIAAALAGNSAPD